MMRTVYDVEDAHVRLQAPEGWVRLEPRGPRIVLRDASCPTPIFVEPLPILENVDSWIGRLAGDGKRITGLQRSSAPDARRFVVSWMSGGAPLERAYRIQRVPSYRAATGVWVAASIDLDGDRKRSRLLGSVFPYVVPAPQLPGGSGLRQYFEDDQRSSEGEHTGPGFTLRLPRFHSIRDASELGWLVHDHDQPLAWMTFEGSTKEPAAALAEIEARQRSRGGTVDRLSNVACLVTFPDAARTSPAAGRECLLSTSLGERAHLAVTIRGSRATAELQEFLRWIHRWLRPWDDQFRGLWQARTGLSWTEAKLATPVPRPAAPPPAPVPAPAPAPAPVPAPVPNLQAEWEARLSGALLRYSTSGSAGYDPRFSFGGYRESHIFLYRGHRVEWNEVVHTSASYGPLYIGGPTRETRSGRWAVEVAGNSARLVLYCGSQGVHRFELGVTASGVLLDGRRYSLTRV